ncbi:MAG: type II toxin-antitoxin system HipA family toxin [Alphaproteobacteria bacterium]
MTAERQCHVFIVLPGRTEFVRAGHFRLSEADGGFPCGEFIYARNYLERTDAVELDPVELRLSPRRYRTARLNGFFGALRDAMPDQWGRRVLDSRSPGPRLDDFSYLQRGPDDRAGALGIAEGPAPPVPRLRFRQPRDLARLREAARAFAAARSSGKEPAETQARAYLPEPTSMGGARPKSVVQDGRHLFLVKFARPGDRWNFPRVEHALLRLARECGLDTADSHIEHRGGHDMLMVRRFDREWRESGWLRHRMVSAMTILRSEDRPGERERWSYLRLADEIRRISACPARDLRELFTRMCFNAAVSNLDDHPRNHALLAPGRIWRLSPAYDLNPYPVPEPHTRQLAMICGRYGRQANRANLLSGHGRFRLPEKEAAAIFDRVAATAGARWYATMRQAGVTEPDCETISGAFLPDGLFTAGSPAPVPESR